MTHLLRHVIIGILIGILIGFFLASPGTGVPDLPWKNDTQGNRHGQLYGGHYGISQSTSNPQAPGGQTTTMSIGPGFDIVSRMHAEGHASAIMRLLRDQEGVLFINNPEICVSCFRNLNRMIPGGGRLDVVLPNGTRVPFPRSPQ